MKLIISSCLNIYKKDENGNKKPINFGNKNNILTNIKKYTKNRNCLLFIASNPNDIENTKLYSNLIFSSFEKTYPFKEYIILDNSNIEEIDRFIQKSDMIFLGGGHLPTQNTFFNSINLRNKLKDYKNLIIGGSAGSMNMADTVLSFPELPGESFDPNFKKQLKGLGLTNINILPYYNIFKDHILDDKKYIEEIVLDYTKYNNFYGLNDGSYILVDEQNVFLYGEIYEFKNKNIIKINKDNMIQKLF